VGAEQLQLATLGSTSSHPDMKVRTPYDHWYKIDTLTGGLVDGRGEEGGDRPPWWEDGGGWGRQTERGRRERSFPHR
jgi:hypothetical protein